MLKAVAESKRVVQTGMQQRSWPHFQQARDIVAGGGLGQVTFIRTYWYQNHLQRRDVEFQGHCAELTVGGGAV